MYNSVCHCVIPCGLCVYFIYLYFLIYLGYIQKHRRGCHFFLVSILVAILDSKWPPLKSRFAIYLRQYMSYNQNSGGYTHIMGSRFHMVLLCLVLQRPQSWIFKMAAIWNTYFAKFWKQIVKMKRLQMMWSNLLHKACLKYLKTDRNHNTIIECRIFDRMNLISQQTVIVISENNYWTCIYFC